MNTNKFLVGGIIGGVASFLLGWLVWGMLLMNLITEHTSVHGTAAMRGEENMIWWALIVGNLFYGLLLSYILNKSGTASAGAGAAAGAVFGLLFAGAVNFYIYAQMDLWDTTAIAVDIAANTAVTAIIGGIVGWYLGMGKKSG